MFEEGSSEIGQASYLDEERRDSFAERSPKGRFVRFNDEIGYSHFKTVYRAYDADTGREVCWNSVKATRLSEVDRRTVLKEIGVLKTLTHQNIVGCVDSWVDRERREIVFITEILSGGSLNNYLHKIKRPKLKVIKNWCVQILQGLEYLHSHKPPVIHRNVKCENIFLNTNTNEVKLGELGAFVASLDSGRSLYGTMECPVPELVEGHIGPSADIYCFGMVLLQIATLKPPYSECVNQAQIYKRIQNQIKPLSLDQINHPSLKSIITSCIAPVNQRPTVSELLAMEFWKLNEEVDKYQEKPPTGSEEREESSLHKNNPPSKKFSKQNMVLETQPYQETCSMKLNSIIDKKERENEVVLVFNLENKRKYELKIPRNKEKKQDFDQSIAYLTRMLSGDRHNIQEGIRQEQSHTANSYLQTKLSESRGKQLQQQHFGLPINCLPIIEDPLERIKQLFHSFYQQYKNSLELIGGFYYHAINQQEMQLRFKIQNRELQRIHNDQQQRLRSLSLHFKNDDFLSMLNCSSIHHQLRQDINMDLSEYNLYEVCTSDLNIKQGQVVIRSVETIHTNMITIISENVLTQEEYRSSKVSQDAQCGQPCRNREEDVLGTDKTTN